MKLKVTKQEFPQHSYVYEYEYLGINVLTHFFIINIPYYLYTVWFRSLITSFFPSIFIFFVKNYGNKKNIKNVGYKPVILFIVSMFCLLFHMFGQNYAFSRGIFSHFLHKQQSVFSFYYFLILSRQIKSKLRSGIN